MTANLSAAYVWPVKLRTEAAVRYAGDSYDDDAHLFPLKSYTLVDLRLSYPLRDNVELYGRVENLTDQHYISGVSSGLRFMGAPRLYGIRLLKSF